MFGGLVKRGLFFAARTSVRADNYSRLHSRKLNVSLGTCEGDKVNECIRWIGESANVALQKNAIFYPLIRSFSRVKNVLVLEQRGLAAVLKCTQR